MAEKAQQTGKSPKDGKNQFDDYQWRMFSLSVRGLILLAFIVMAFNLAWILLRPHITYTVKTGDLTTIVFGKGNTEPINLSKIYSRLPDLSWVQELGVEPGDKVRKGQLIARLDSMIIQAKLDSLLVQLEDSERLMKYNMYEFGNGNLSHKSIQMVVRDHEELKKVVNDYKKNLAKLVLIAPRDGYVMIHRAPLHSRVMPGDELFWVGQPEPLWARIELDEEKAKYVSKGDKAKLYIGFKKYPKMKDYDIEGTVAQVRPPTSPDKPVYEVFINLPEGINPGMDTPVRAEIEDQHKKGIVYLPLNAIYELKYAFVKKDDDSIEVRKIKLGIKDKDGNRHEILSGLKPGEQIVRYPVDYAAHYGAKGLPSKYLRSDKLYGNPAEQGRDQSQGD